jgi:hypothetical protein
VQSVNGSTGVVVIDADDVGAYSNTNPSLFVNVAQASASAPVQSVTGTLVGGTSADPVINIPTLDEIGAYSNTNPSSFINVAQAPVQSVNGSTGIVVIDADDVGAYSNTNPSGFINVFPASGMAVSNGTAFIESKATPTGNVVGTTDTQTLINKTFTGYKETVFTLTDAATVTPNVSNGTIQFWTLGDNRTLNTSGINDGESLTLMIEDDSAYSITWSTVKFVTNTAPTLATTGYTVVELWKANSNTYGALVGNVP